MGKNSTGKFGSAAIKNLRLVSTYPGHASKKNQHHAIQ
jgi:hypothetical protein